MIPTVDRGSVSRGAAVALAFSAVAVIGYQVVKAAVGSDESSNWPILFATVMLVGWIVGGRTAGLRRPDAPLTHGALSACVSFLVVAVIGIAVRVATGHAGLGRMIIFDVLVTVLAASVGTFGGFLASRRS